MKSWGFIDGCKHPSDTELGIYLVEYLLAKGGVSAMAETSGIPRQTDHRVIEILSKLVPDHINCKASNLLQFGKCNLCGSGGWFVEFYRVGARALTLLLAKNIVNKLYTKLSV